MGNNIIDGKATGVYVYDEGRVEIKEGNKIERNAFHGVAVRDGGECQVEEEKENRAHTHKHTHTHSLTHTHTHTHTHCSCMSTHQCVCVCVCILTWDKRIVFVL